MSDAPISQTVELDLDAWAKSPIEMLPQLPRYTCETHGEIGQEIVQFQMGDEPAPEVFCLRCVRDQIRATCRIAKVTPP